MAILKRGLFGPVSGKVGNMVGGTWKGINYMRTMPTEVNNPSTPAQMQQRNAFSMVLQFLKPFTDFVKIGYKGYAVGMSAYNAAMSYILRNAVVGEYPNFEISYQKVLVSRGSLRGVVSTTASTAGNRTIVVTWNDNSSLSGASPNDQAIVVVYNESKADVSRSLEAGARSSGRAEIVLPQEYAGDAVQVYLAFATMGNHLHSTHKNSISDSIYAGEVTVT